MVPASPATIHPHPALGEALDFDADDLACNRAGRLSARQADRLRGHARFGTVAGGLFALIGLIFSAVFALGGAPPLIVLLCLLALGAAGAVLVQYGRLRRLDSDAGRVEVAEGELRRFQYRKDDRRRYRVFLGEQSYSVSRAAYLAIANGPSRVYYAPRSREVLAIEPLVSSALPGGAR